MDYQSAIAGLGLTISVLTFFYVMRRDARGDMTTEFAAIRKQVHEDREEVDVKISAMDMRLTRVEGKIDGMPTKADLHNPELGQRRLDTKIDVLAETMRPIGSIATRMQDWFLRQAEDAMAHPAPPANLPPKGRRP